jgi:hypothetical protein
VGGGGMNIADVIVLKEFKCHRGLLHEFVLSEDIKEYVD